MCLELLTKRVILAFGSIDFPIHVDPQEELVERKQLSPPYVPFKMIVAANMPSLWPPSPTQGPPSGPRFRDQLKL